MVDETKSNISCCKGLLLDGGVIQIDGELEVGCCNELQLVWVPFVDVERETLTLNDWFCAA